MKARLTARTRFTEGDFSLSNMDRLFQNTDGMTYCSIFDNDLGSTSYLYVVNFDFSVLPNDAIVDSYAVKLKYYQQGNTLPTQKLTYWPDSISGTNLDIPINGSSPQIYTFPCPLPFNQIKRSAFGIRLSLRPNDTTPLRGYFYGCEIEVEYHFGELKLKQNGEWKDATPYVKQNGAWVKQDDYRDLFTVGEWIKKGKWV